MGRLEKVLRRAAADTADAEIRFAVVGGLAVSARTQPRFTRDIDLAVMTPTDEEAEQTVFQVQQRGYTLVTLLEHQQTGRIATARLIPPGEDEDGVIVDLLFNSSGIECEVVAVADVVELLPGLRAPVARVGHLMAMKLLSRDDDERPQDAADIAALRASMSGPEADLASDAVRLIEERGYARGRDLAALLAEQLAKR